MPRATLHGTQPAQSTPCTATRARDILISSFNNGALNKCRAGAAAAPVAAAATRHLLAGEHSYFLGTREEDYGSATCRQLANPPLGTSHAGCLLYPWGSGSRQRTARRTSSSHMLHFDDRASLMCGPAERHVGCAIGGHMA